MTKLDLYFLYRKGKEFCEMKKKKNQDEWIL
jgi:hypothetical protein